MKINVSLIIPCYNEAKNLPFLINRCEKLIEEFPMEVILVDNGSTDNSEKIIAKHSDQQLPVSTTNQASFPKWKRLVQTLPQDLALPEVQ